MGEVCKVEDLEDVLIIWIGQVNVKNGTAADEVIKEQAKVTGQQMSVTNSVHQNWYVFCYKNEIIVKMEPYKTVLLKKLRTDSPQFCLFFYPQDCKYSILQPIWHFNTLINKKYTPK
jgi:hypothetical protein